MQVILTLQEKQGKAFLGRLQKSIKKTLSIKEAIKVFFRGKKKAIFVSNCKKNKSDLQ